MNEGTITRCVSTANISGNGGIYTKGRGTANFFLGAAMGGVILYQNGAYAGGITGINKNAVTNCYSTGNISIVGEGYKSAGGIAGMNSWSATIENSVALNEELTAVGKSNGIALDGTGLIAHNNARYSVGVNMAVQNQAGKLIYTYYRHDMRITKEKEAKDNDDDNETDSDSKSGKVPKRQLVDYTTTQNKEWWVSTPKKFGFSFGMEKKAPWVWDDELIKSTLNTKVMKRKISTLILVTGCITFANAEENTSQNKKSRMCQKWHILSSINHFTS